MSDIQGAREPKKCGVQLRRHQPRTSLHTQSGRKRLHRRNQPALCPGHQTCHRQSTPRSHATHQRQPSRSTGTKTAAFAVRYDAKNKFHAFSAVGAGVVVDATVAVHRAACCCTCGEKGDQPHGCCIFVDRQQPCAPAELMNVGGRVHRLRQRIPEGGKTRWRCIHPTGCHKINEHRPKGSMGRNHDQRGLGNRKCFYAYNISYIIERVTVHGEPHSLESASYSSITTPTPTPTWLPEWGPPNSPGCSPKTNSRHMHAGGNSSRKLYIKPLSPSSCVGVFSCTA